MPPRASFGVSSLVVVVVDDVDLISRSDVVLVAVLRFEGGSVVASSIVMRRGRFQIPPLPPLSCRGPSSCRLLYSRYNVAAPSFILLRVSWLNW